MNKVYILARYSLQLRQVLFSVAIQANNMKIIILSTFAFLILIPSLARGQNELWIVVSRPSQGKVIYEMNGKKLLDLDGVASELRELGKQDSVLPAVRSIFEPSCTLEDFSSLRGWLGKLGVLDGKYYLADPSRRAIAEFGMVGRQQAFPAKAAEAINGERQR